MPASATATSNGNTGGRTPTHTVPYKITATGSRNVNKAHNNVGFLSPEVIATPFNPSFLYIFGERNCHISSHSSIIGP
jgi:hypothetical protein